MTLKSHFYQFISKNMSLLARIQALLDNGNVYIFGGYIRDYFDNTPPRDIDLVVKFNDPNKTIKDLPIEASYQSINSFGGSKEIYGDIQVDLWRLEDTWAFRNGLLSPTPNNLLKSVFLNIDSLLYSINEDKFIDNCDIAYKEMQKRKELDIVLPINPQINLNLLRAIIYKRKYCLKYSLCLLIMLNDYIDESKSFSFALDYHQTRHYEKLMITKNELDKEVNEIKILAHDIPDSILRLNLDEMKNTISVTNNTKIIKKAILHAINYNKSYEIIIPLINRLSIMNNAELQKIITLMISNHCRKDLLEYSLKTLAEANQNLLIDTLKKISKYDRSLAIQLLDEDLMQVGTDYSKIKEEIQKD